MTRYPGLGWRTRVQFAVREDGVAGLRAHRSHRVIDVGECLIAHRRSPIWTSRAAAGPGRPPSRPWWAPDRANGP